MTIRLGRWTWPAAKAGGIDPLGGTAEPGEPAELPRRRASAGAGDVVGTRDARRGRRHGRDRRGGVRVLEGVPDAGRRGFLQAAAVQGVSLPVACVLFGRDARAAAVADAGPAAA